MHPDDRVTGFFLHHDGNAEILSGPTSRIRRWTKCHTQKVLNWLILRSGKQDANTELVLNILPFVSNRRQTVGGEGTPAISKCALQDELPGVATTSNVVLAVATTKKCQTTNS